MKENGEREEDAVALDFNSYIADQWNGLWRFAYLITGHRSDAEDIVQTVLVRVWPRWGEICAKGDPGVYLRRSIVNAKVSFWRKTRRQTPYADISTDLDALSDHAEVVTDALAIARALQTLPAKQRAVVALRYLEDRSYEEIAAICGIAQATARSQARNALNRLRNEMGNSDE
jgi:RNA polymerase sigma-70 factor (sigma-E family)